MATLKCLACGQDNNVGVESCTSCSSSLNLKLCGACEAINANRAERCHCCGAQFRLEPQIVSAVEEGLAYDAPEAGKALPATWVASAEAGTARGRTVRAALWIVPLLAAAGLSYHFYGTSQAGPAEAPAEVEVAQPATAPTPTTPEIAELKQAPAVAVRASSVTHTLKSTPAAVPTVSERAPATMQRETAPVTHTRAAVAQATEAAAVPAAAAVGASVPSEAAKNESAACAPSVVALGLCQSN
jgi:hypothetical protein